MSIDDIVQPIVAFVKDHEGWAVPIAFLVAFGESFAFFSLLWPGTAILVGISALLAASGMEISVLWPAIVAAGFGGGVGYALSFWLGHYFKDSIPNLWPFTSNPDLIPQGKEFFDRYGAWGVFLGHFFGPVRAVIPVVAGMFDMRQIPFQIANFASAFIWAAGVIAPAFFLVTFKDQVFALMRQYEIVVAFVMFALGLFNSTPHKLLAVPSLIAFVALGVLQLYAGGNLLPLWAAGALGALVGDLVAYHIGGGLKTRTDFFYLEVTARRLARSRQQLEKYGDLALMTSKFSEKWRAAVPLTAGLVCRPLVPFILVSALSSALWSIVLLLPWPVMRWAGILKAVG